MKKKKLFAIFAALACSVMLLTSPMPFGEEGSGMITYLSNMEWTASKIYNDALPSRDENVAGEELWLYDVYFEKGVCLHAMPGENAYIEVDIEGKGYKTFYAYAGTAESELFNVTMASVRFKFKADGKVIEKTSVLTPRQSPTLITVDVTGCKTFRIEMDDGGDGISGDWGALGNALFSDAESVAAIEQAVKATETAGDKTETDAGSEQTVNNKGSKIEPAGGSGCGSTVSAKGAAAACVATSAAAAAGLLAKRSRKRRESGN